MRRPRINWLTTLSAWVRVRPAAVLAGLVPALVVLASVSVAAAPAASAGTVPPPPSGWTTVYSDDFSGAAGSGVDSSWTYDQGTQYNGTGCTGAWGTGEVETDTNSTANVSEDGSGDLNITPVSNGGAWTSGRIETVADDFAAPAGGEMEVSATIKQPDPANGLGYWPAFWMLGAGYRASGAGTSGTMDCSNWPSTGEIDIMEDVNALSDVAGTLHCGIDPNGPCDETDGLGSGLVACAGCQTGFNTYSVIVNRTDTSNESLTWELNGTPYETVTESQVGTSAWQAAVDHGFFLILDVAVGGAFPDPVCGCTTPTSTTSSGAAMSVSDVAVYTTTGSGGGGGGTTAPAAPTGLTVTGTTASSASLAWTAPSGTVSGYDVYENGSQVATVTGTSATISGLAASTGYSFTVTAFNSAGESPQSNAVTATTSGSGGGSGGGSSCPVTATADISADCFSSSQGPVDVTAATGDASPAGVDGNQVAQLANGDYLEYPGVDFGSGSGQFVARVASGAVNGVSGLVEVVLDNPANAPVGSFAVGNTGGWSSWVSVPANISTVTGTHNVYLEFVSNAVGDPPFVSLHYFSFPTT